MWTAADGCRGPATVSKFQLLERCKSLEYICLQDISLFTQCWARCRNGRRGGSDCDCENSTNVICDALNCCSGGCSRNAGADSRRVVLSCSALVARLFRSGHTALRRSQFPVSPNRVPPHSTAGDGPLWERSCPHQSGTIGSEGSQRRVGKGERARADWGMATQGGLT